MKGKNLSKKAVVLSALAIATLGGCKGSSEEQQQQQQMQAQMPDPIISVETIGYSTLDLSKSYPATIKGKTDTEIRPLVTGNITRVFVDEGSHVKKGQPLFELDKVQFEAAVAQAKAAIASAETAVQSAQLTASQKQALFDKNIISEFENQLAKNDLNAAKAQLANAKAALVNAEKSLSYTLVTAPTDGIVGSIPFREGSLASPSMAQPLTTVSDNSQIYAYFSITEKDLLGMTKKGSMTVDESVAALPEVQLRLANGDLLAAQGKVKTVSGVLGDGTGSVTVRALFNNPNGMVRSGSSGQVVIPQRNDGVFVVPQKATFELQDMRFVYIVNDSNIVRRQAITVDPLDDGQSYIVTSGLKPGDRIAIEGVGVGAKLQDGTKIQPVDPSEKDAAMQAQIAAMQQQQPASK